MEETHDMDIIVPVLTWCVLEPEWRLILPGFGGRALNRLVVKYRLLVNSLYAGFFVLFFLKEI